MANHVDQRIWDAIVAMKPIGAIAMNRCKPLLAARRRQQPLTTAHLAEFLEVMQPLVSEMIKDEAKAEEELGEFRELFIALHKFTKTVNRSAR
jgi:CRISPR/Cas system CSM-associated protein Csm2 small subunit